MVRPTTTATEPRVAGLEPPLPERLISDVETLKALSDPLRIQILETMTHGQDEAWTVKRIARALGVGPTKLYHHFKILEDRGLIRPASQQLVRGIVETTYQVAQLSLRLDRRLIAGESDDTRATAAETLTVLFDLAKRDLEAALAAGVVPLDNESDPSSPFILTRTHLRIPADRAAEFRTRLLAVMDEFRTESERGTTIELGLLIALHKMALPSGSKRHR